MIAFLELSYRCARFTREVQKQVFTARVGEI